MNKSLLIWNIVVTILLLLVALSACTSSDTRVEWLVTQVQNQATAIGELQATVAQDKQLIQAQTIQIAALQSYTQSSINQIQAYLQATGR